MPKFRENIKKMQPYKPPLEGRSGEDYLLLDFNERTTEPSPKVKQALKDFIEQGRLQVYPEYGDLEKKIAQYSEVSEFQAIVTNGGDQGIDIICRAHLSRGDKVIIPSPSFAMHNQSAEIQGADILDLRYNQDGSFPLDNLLGLIDNENRIRLIILCNPSNPLGTAIPLKDVEKILQKAKEKDIAVLHDEAYFEFSRLTVKNLLRDYNNLYIIRTFSKAFGLVSARVGYVLSREENLEELLKIRGPYDVNMFAKTAVLAALEDIDYVKDYVKEVMEESKPKLELFLKEKGIKFFPSSANFLFLNVTNSDQIIERLKTEGILTRPKEGPNKQRSVRITIGTLEDTQRFIDAFEKVVN